MFFRCDAKSRHRARVKSLYLPHAPLLICSRTFMPAVRMARRLNQDLWRVGRPNGKLLGRRIISGALMGLQVRIDRRAPTFVEGEA